MKKPRLAVLIATHVAALCAGLLFFRPPSQAQSSPQTAESPNGPVAASDEATSARGSSRPRSVAETLAKPSVQRAAWKALAYEGLSRPDRMKASALILKGWIRVDWREALDTVMRETPDDFDLLDEFQDTFARESEAVWQLIDENRYGVLTKAVRTQWTSALARQDEATLRRLIEKLPVSGKLAASDVLTNRPHKRP